MGLAGDGAKCRVSTGEVPFTNESDGGLKAPAGSLGLGRSMQDGQRVFGASASFVAFKGVGISVAELRENKIGIDFERSTIVDQRVIKLARHAQDFRVRILRVGFVWQQ